MGLLGALRLRLVDPALGHRVRLAVALADDVAGLAHRDAGDGRRVGSHVGDEADVALGRLDALVQPLGDRHRPLRAEAQAAARLLLERGRRERRRRATASASASRACVTTGRSSRIAATCALGGRLVAGCRWPRRRCGRARPGTVSPAAVARMRLDRPVLAGGEGVDLALALDHEADGDRLDATGGQAAAGPSCR